MSNRGHSMDCSVISESAEMKDASKFNAQETLFASKFLNYTSSDVVKGFLGDFKQANGTVYLYRITSVHGKNLLAYKVVKIQSGPNKGKYIHSLTLLHGAEAFYYFMKPQKSRVYNLEYLMEVSQKIKEIIGVW